MRTVVRLIVDVASTVLVVASVSGAARVLARSNVESGDVALLEEHATVANATAASATAFTPIRDGDGTWRSERGARGPLLRDRPTRNTGVPSLAPWPARGWWGRRT